MRPLAVLLSALFLTSILIASEDDEACRLLVEHQSRRTGMSDQALRFVNGLNAFGFEYLARVEGKEEGNSGFLPLAAYATLGLAASAANVDLQGDILKALKAGAPGFDEFSVLLGELGGLTSREMPAGAWRKFSSVVVAEGTIVSSSFKKAASLFETRIENRNLRSPSSVATLNGVIERETAGRVRSLMELQSGGAIFLDAFAIRFPWRIGFDPAQTTLGEFKLADGKVLSIPFMRHENRAFLGLQSSDGFQMVSMPLQNGYALDVILPDASLEAVIGKLRRFDYLKWVEALTIQRLELLFPKHRVEFKFRLNAPLRPSVPKLFDEASRLVGIAPPGLAVSAMIQAFCVDFAEDGGTMGSSSPNSPGATRLAIDRPFIEILRHRTGAVIGAWVVKNPVRLDRGLPPLLSDAK